MRERISLQAITEGFGKALPSVRPPGVVEVVLVCADACLLSVQCAEAKCASTGATAIDCTTATWAGNQ